MQRRRVVKAAGEKNGDDGTARKLTKKPSDERVEETAGTKKKSGVFRKLGFMLHPDKQDLGSTVKKRKGKKATERKRRQAVWNPDKKVHFNIEKGHPTIPLKGDMITDVQKKVFLKFAQDAVKKGPLEYSLEFLSKVKPYVGQPMERKIFDANPTKNRYKDVVCNDVTRVILNDGYDGDYIHANYVNGLNSPFILTQGPTPVTQIEFWRMIVHTRASYIVMLCEVLEDGKPKCAQYWPEKVGETITHGMFSISCNSEDEKDQNITKRTLTVKNTESGKEHILKHLHTKSWPDKSVPNSTLSLLRMLYIVRNAPGPVTVHCSAGIGRTGTFVAVEVCLQILTDGKELDLLAAVKALRNSRAGSVQVDIQYMTLVQMIINYGKDNGYWEDGDLDDRVELLTWNIQQFIQTRGRVDHIMATPSTPNLACAPQPPQAAPVPSAPPAPQAQPAQTPAPTPIREPPAAAHVKETASPAPTREAPPIPTREPVLQATQPSTDKDKPKAVKKDMVVKESAVTVMAPVVGNGLVTKDSTEDAEEIEAEAKVQSTQKLDVQSPAPPKDEDGLVTVIPLAPGVVQPIVSPIVPLPTPPSPPKKPKPKVTDRQVTRKSKERLNKNRSEYFL